VVLGFFGIIGLSEAHHLITMVFAGQHQELSFEVDSPDLVGGRRVKALRAGQD